MSLLIKTTPGKFRPKISLDPEKTVTRVNGPFYTFIPSNGCRVENGYHEISELLRKHAHDPNAVRFIADMIE